MMGQKKIFQNECSHHKPNNNHLKQQKCKIFIFFGNSQKIFSYFRYIEERVIMKRTFIIKVTEIQQCTYHSNTYQRKQIPQQSMLHKSYEIQTEQQ